MKILKTIGLVLAGLLFLIVLISVFLPSTYHVERSIVINKKPAVPFGLIKNFKDWNQWSPWHARDTQMQILYSETTGEIGSWYQWESSNPDVGRGKMTITKLAENQLIEMAFSFDDMDPEAVTFKFEPAGDGVKITWAMDGGCSGMPWYWVVPGKYFGLMMDKFIGPDYEKGLNNLKTISETMPDAETIAGFEIEYRNLNPMLISGIRSKIKTSEMTSAAFAKWFAMLSQELSQQNIEPAGPPMSIYHEYGPKEVDIEAVIPVKSIGTNKGPVAFRVLTPTNTMVVKYFGDYNNVEMVYIAAYDYLKQHGKSSTGAPMEIYVTDPGMEKDTAKWLTEIVFPLDSI